jgi:hypothetical protein
MMIIHLSIAACLKHRIHLKLSEVTKTSLADRHAQCLSRSDTLRLLRVRLYSLVHRLFIVLTHISILTICASGRSIDPVFVGLGEHEPSSIDISTIRKMN